MTQPQLVDGKYQVTRLLGQGGMGAVYEARHLGTNRRVAVKVINVEALQASPDIVRRFQLEARASGVIESDHVVQVLDTGIDGTTNSPYMVMELLNGEDLQQVIHRIGPLQPEIALRIVAQAAIGLRRAHEAGIVHRDIKTANIFLSRNESGEITVKLLDFGIAKVRSDQLTKTGDHGLTRTGSMLGSPLYMSPEQAKGMKDLDARSDIWSLGVVLHEALVGKPPHVECDTLGALIVAICSPQVPPIQNQAPWTRPEIAAIYHKACAPEREARYQSAAEMYQAVLALLPEGVGLRESMLVPMGREVLETVAPRFATAPMVAAGSTTAGFGSTSPPGLPRPGVMRWIAPLVAVAAMGSAAGFFMLRSTADARPTTLSVASVSGVTTSMASAPTPTMNAFAEIVPPTASVEVDGVPRTVDQGRVQISGEGVHRVHLRQGSNEKTFEVELSSLGLAPSARLELPLTPGTAVHGVIHLATPAAPHATVQVPVTRPTPSASLSAAREM